MIRPGCLCPAASPSNDLIPRNSGARRDQCPDWYGAGASPSGMACGAADDAGLAGTAGGEAIGALDEADGAVA